MNEEFYQTEFNLHTPKRAELLHFFIYSYSLSLTGAIVVNFF